MQELAAVDSVAEAADPVLILELLFCAPPVSLFDLLGAQAITPGLISQTPEAVFPLSLKLHTSPATLPLHASMANCGGFIELPP